MIFAVAIGILSAFAVLVAFWRMDIKKFMGYPAAMDFGVTIILLWMLHGSYVGMVAAVIGGLVFSGCITLIRKGYGYKKLHWRNFKLVWVEYEGTWKRAINDQVHNVSTNIKQGKSKCLNLKLSVPQIACIVAFLILASSL